MSNHWSTPEATLERAEDDVDCVVRERDEARAELQKTRDNFHDVWESRDKVIEERERALAEIERLRGIIQEWSYPRLYVQPGFERETLIAQLHENLTGALRPKIEAAEERGAAWALERHGNPFAGKTLEQYAEEICRDARGKR
jgi:hypothetical protein